MWSMVPEKSKLTNLANIAKKRCLFANGNGSGHTSQMRSMKRMAILRTTLKSMEGMPLDTEMRYYDISQYLKLNTRYSILDSQNSILDTQHSILDTRYSILDTRYLILNTPYLIFHTRHLILGTRYSILDT